jgi:hypothetical protein
MATFEKFLRIAGFKFDQSQPQRPPEPDIIAWRGSSPFGVEITYFHREPTKQKESEEDKCLERSLAIYRTYDGPSLELHIMWAPYFTLRKENREAIAKKIAALAIDHAPRCGVSANLDWQQFDEQLMSAINHISIYAMPGESQDNWTAARGAFVPTWSVVELQDQINRKRTKPTRYQSIYAETWLLIVSAFGAPSSWMETNDAIRTATFASPFTKTFLLSSFPLEVIDLHTCPCGE